MLTRIQMLGAALVIAALLPSAASAQRYCPPGSTWSYQVGACVRVVPVGQPNYQVTEYQQPPPSVVREPLWGWIIAGAIVLGVSYGLTVAINAALDTDGDDPWVYIPVAGPWLDLGLGGDGLEWAAAIVPSGIAQAAGLTMLIVGLAIQRDVVRVRGARGGVPIADGWSLTPWVSPSTAGAQLSATWL